MCAHASDRAEGRPRGGGAGCRARARATAISCSLALGGHTCLVLLLVVVVLHNKNPPTPCLSAASVWVRSWVRSGVHHGRCSQKGVPLFSLGARPGLAQGETATETKARSKKIVLNAPKITVADRSKILAGPFECVVTARDLSSFIVYNYRENLYNYRRVLVYNYRQHRIFYIFGLTISF